MELIKIFWKVVLYRLYLFLFVYLMGFIILFTTRMAIYWEFCFHVFQNVCILCLVLLAIAFKENGRWKLRTQSSLPMPQVLMPSPTALFFKAVEHVHVLSPKTSGPKGTMIFEWTILWVLYEWLTLVLFWLGGWGMLMAVTVAVVALIAAAKQSLFPDLNQRKVCAQKLSRSLSFSLPLLWK
jgi:hypothetical protein